jgi:hypothetical protein
VGWGVVDLVEEVGEGSGEAWCGGWVEFDVDGGGVVGDGAGEVEEVAGGGAVFVGVLEVGVEVVGEPVFGVGGEQAEDHLQAAAVGVVHGSFGVGVDEVCGEFGGDGLEGGFGGGDVLVQFVDLVLGGVSSRLRAVRVRVRLVWAAPMRLRWVSRSAWSCLRWSRAAVRAGLATGRVLVWRVAV